MAEHITSFDEDTIQTAALGRPFTLGMLYDRRRDALFPGVTLWNPEELKENITKEEHTHTDFHVTASDSITEKTNLLNVSGSVNLSVLGGLISVTGSAEYLNNTRTSLRQQRLILQYKAETWFRSLTMSQMGKTNISKSESLINGLATHVVTAIMYGAEAYFVFDRQSSESDTQTSVDGYAKLLMDKLVLVTADAKVALKMTDEEKAAINKFSCTFHGDFKLPNNPVTFEEAVEAYQKLPTLLGENGEHSIPVMVWMYPLERLYPQAAKFKKEIRDNLVTLTTTVIEELNKTEMRCNDLLRRKPILHPMEEKIQKFKNHCSDYKLQFTQTLGSVLPSIRGGKQDESALKDILEKHEKSPFNSTDLDKWLTQMENESCKLSTILGQLKEMGIDMDANLDELLYDLRIKKIVSFSFTSVAQPDDFLETLSNSLSTTLGKQLEPKDHHKRNAGVSEQGEWLTLAGNIKRVREQLKLFQQLKKQIGDEAKFIVGSQYDARNPGVCIYVWEDGCGPVQFIAPSKPDTPVVTETRMDGFILEASKADSATVKYVVEVKPHEGEWERPSEQTSQGLVTLSELKPGTEYEIRATAVGRIGYSVSSDSTKHATLSSNT